MKKLSKRSKIIGIAALVLLLAVGSYILLRETDPIMQLGVEWDYEACKWARIGGSLGYINGTNQQDLWDEMIRMTTAFDKLGYFTTQNNIDAFQVGVMSGDDIGRHYPGYPTDSPKIVKLWEDEYKKACGQYYPEIRLAIQEQRLVK